MPGIFPINGLVFPTDLKFTIPIREDFFPHQWWYRTAKNGCSKLIKHVKIVGKINVICYELELCLGRIQSMTWIQMAAKTFLLVDSPTGMHHKYPPGPWLPISFSFMHCVNNNLTII